MPIFRVILPCNRPKLRRPYVNMLALKFVVFLLLCASALGRSQRQVTRGSGLRRSLISSLPSGIAGGVAGSTGTTLLFPLDAAKTLRQTNPSQYKSLGGSLRALLTTRAGKVRFTPATLRRLYSGVGESKPFEERSDACEQMTYVIPLRRFILTLSLTHPQALRPSGLSPPRSYTFTPIRLSRARFL